MKPMRDKGSETKRITRREFIAGAAAAGTLGALPGIAQAACAKLYTAASSQREMLTSVFRDTGVAIEFADAGASHVDSELVRVSVSNLNKQPVELRKLSPGRVHLNGKAYSLNARLASGPITVRGGGVYHVWLHPEKDPQHETMESPDNSKGGLVALNIARKTGNGGVHRDTQMAFAVIA